MIPGYMTIKEAAQKWGVSIRCVNGKCNNGVIPAALKFGNVWAIPADAEMPTKDMRVKTGKYKNWRKKCNSQNS